MFSLFVSFSFLEISLAVSWKSEKKPSEVSPRRCLFLLRRVSSKSPAHSPGTSLRPSRLAASNDVPEADEQTSIAVHHESPFTVSVRASAVVRPLTLPACVLKAHLGIPAVPANEGSAAAPAQGTADAAPPGSSPGVPEDPTSEPRRAPPLRRPRTPVSSARPPPSRSRTQSPAGSKACSLAFPPPKNGGNGAPAGVTAAAGRTPWENE